MRSSEHLRAEQAFHDAQAAGRAVRFVDDVSLRFSDNWYLDHETWIRPAIAELGDVQGRAVLDLGCGHGMAAVVLARRGARVTGIDVSAGYLAEAQRRAAANECVIDFVQGDGKRLPFADASFDCAWGNAILHHLDLSLAASELRRVLRPRGVAVCCEPWGGNRLLHFARCHLPYPGKQRTRDERPLEMSDLRALREQFPAMRIKGYQLVTMIRRVAGTGWMGGGLERCDGWLLARIPSLWRFCRYVVLTLSG